jgi:hypothetical protein
MLTSRRWLLFAGTGIVVVDRHLPAQPLPAFSLAFDEVPIDTGESVIVSVTASAPANITIHIESREGPKFSTPNISIKEPHQVLSTKFPKGLPAPGTRVAIDVGPTGKSNPSVAVVFGEGMDIPELEVFTKRVPFKADPAKLPTPGAFTINLPLESMVVTKIWRGSRTTGAPVLTKRDSHHYPPEDYVTWDLKSAGKLVDPGQYIALLTCTPVRLQTANVKTVVYSSFQVEN